jgi:hypothetical protein
MADGKENCDTCGPGDLKVERVNGRNRVMVPDNFMADKLGSPDQQVVEAMEVVRMLESQGIRIGEANDLSRIQPGPVDDQPTIRLPQPEAPEIPRDFETPGDLDEPPIAIPRPPRHETPPIDIPGYEPTPTPIIRPEPRPLIRPRNFTIAETDAAQVASTSAYQVRHRPEGGDNDDEPDLPVVFPPELEIDEIFEGRVDGHGNEVDFADGEHEGYWDKGHLRPGRLPHSLAPDRCESRNWYTFTVTGRFLIHHRLTYWVSIDTPNIVVPIGPPLGPQEIPPLPEDEDSTQALNELAEAVELGGKYSERIPQVDIDAHAHAVLAPLAPCEHPCLQRIQILRRTILGMSEVDRHTGWRRGTDPDHDYRSSNGVRTHQRIIVDVFVVVSVRAQCWVLVHCYMP